MPRNFKLPSDTPKFDGTQDPKAWLSDHLSSVKLHGGNKNTALQCLQLQLTGAARIWLSSLSSGSIQSWEDVAYSFIRNFKGTNKRPASIEELRACTQRTSESIRSYILCWSNIKNSTAHISEEKAIDAFKDGVRRPDFKRKNLGASIPRRSTISWTSPTDGRMVRTPSTECIRMMRRTTATGKNATAN